MALTDYSIKDYVKNNFIQQYKVSDLDELAEQASKASVGRYSQKSSLKILCRYAYVKDNRIMFNVDRRNPDVTIEYLQSSINNESTESNESNKSNDTDDKPKAEREAPKISNQSKESKESK